MKRCSHTDSIQVTELPAEVAGCEDCLKTGDVWLHLRICLTCGHVGCCDSSRYEHATKHFHRTKHPIVQSIEPSESWKWCYADEVLIESRASPAPDRRITGQPVAQRP